MRGMLPSAAQFLRTARGRWQPPRTPRLLLAGGGGGGGGGRSGSAWPRRDQLQMLCLRKIGNLRLHRRPFCSSLMPSDVTVNYKHGLPVITVTLPSRKERCQFTVKPMLMTVGAFIEDIREEDKAIEKIEVFTTGGSAVSASTLMELLLMNDFKLVINGTEYSVHPPLKDKVSTEHITDVDDIRSLVHRLFTALNLEDHQTRKERELLQKMELLKEELLPLEQIKAGLTTDADAKTSRLLWIGLALMSTQGGALAWLTWWVYSWDIMEPVTYFITYGSAMAFYAYFVLTKQDYVYPEARDRQFLHYFHRKSKRQNFNVDQYNKLKDDLAKVEESLKRLKNPLQLHLPIQEINDKL
ncbi:calcium uniporter regulatory subunit MCUb, mitochondrial isoform X2 [Eublepharis macularius]|uniref:Calcium uniporter protein n=1 Tax=Eublepharis macularius TaxID=481883 RepID=A0AA97L7V6_EUBMA|nr:calcium uniporter regulatory subunit MCUb, mitochondrial isoform X2 [Eublepharis macularius]